MKEARFLTALGVILAACSAWAAPGTWSFSAWTADNASATNNLIRGKMPAEESSYNITREGAKNAAVFTDGLLQRASDTTTIGTDNLFVYDFTFPSRVTELRLYSAAWGGRQIINITEVSVVDKQGVVHVIGGSGTSAAGAMRGVLKRDDGEAMCEDAVSISIRFGEQQNGYVGYGEIEVIGEPGDYCRVASIPSYSAELSPREGLYAFTPGETLSFSAPSETFDDESLTRDMTLVRYIVDYWDGVSLTGDTASVSFAPDRAFTLTWEFSLADKPGLEPVSLRYLEKYVRDGLVCMYDGIYNQGTDAAHSTDALTWKDVSGNGRDMGAYSTLPVPTWGDTYAEWSGVSGGEAFTYRVADDEDPLIASITNVTFEIAGENSYTPSDNTGIFFFQNESETGAGAVPFGARYAGNGIYASHYASQYFLGSGWRYGSASDGLGRFGVSFVGRGKSVELYYRKGLVGSASTGAKEKAARGFVIGGKSGINFGAGVKMKAYNIRVYDRALSPAEIRHNDMVDAIRFYGETRYGDGVMKVAWSGVEAGTPYPDYGWTCVTAGGRKIISVADSLLTAADGERIFFIEDGKRAIYEGYSITCGGEEVLAGVEEKAAVTLESFDFSDTVLTWKWREQYRLDLATSGDDGCRVAIGDGEQAAGAFAWADVSEKLKIKAVASENTKFMYWTGDIDGIEDVTASELEVTMDTPRKITAVFFNLDHEPVTASVIDGSSGSWNDLATWENGVMPQDGDTVLLVCSKNTEIDLSSATVRFAKLVVSNTSASAKTVVSCSKWATCINADEIVVGPGGVIKAAGGFYETEMSNRVWIATQKLTVEKGGVISADCAGWAPGNGPGRVGARATGSGGVYGGQAGDIYSMYNASATVYAKPYGSVEWPYDPGSGGGTASYLSSNRDYSGGGAVFIDATGGDVVVDGVVTACGVSPSVSAGGSGGGILIVCNTIDGTGEVTASALDASAYSNGGGGGRLAVHYDSALQAAKDATCAVAFRAKGGYGLGEGYGEIKMRQGGPGSLYFTDNRFLTTPPYRGSWPFSGVWHSSQPLSQTDLSDLDVVIEDERLHFESAEALEMSVKSLRLEGTFGFSRGLSLSNISFNVAGDVTASSASLTVCGRSSRIGGNLFLAGAKNRMRAAMVFLEAMPTNVFGGFGAELSVAGTVSVESNATFNVVAASRNGAVARILARDFLVYEKGLVTASGLGYMNGAGPSFVSGFASSHGGRGAGSRDMSYLIYGDEFHPLTAGSGMNTFGGGVVYITAERRFLLDGEISADGGSALSGACGAGGSVYLDVSRLLPSSGTISADGGSAGFGGGGGRVALYYTYGDHGSLAVSAAAGGSSVNLAYPATDGTIYVKRRNAGFRMIVR